MKHAAIAIAGIFVASAMLRALLFLAAVLAAGCCSQPHARLVARPDPPALETVRIREIASVDANGRRTPLVWVIDTAEAFKRNMEREQAYVRALEAAPAWDGPPPPRPE